MCALCDTRGGEGKAGPSTMASFGPSASERRGDKGGRDAIADLCVRSRMREAGLNTERLFAQNK